MPTSKYREKKITKLTVMVSSFFKYFFHASIVIDHVIYKKISSEKILIKQFRRNILRELISKKLY